MKLPKYVWFILNPEGAAIQVYLERPALDELAFAMPMDRGWRSLPSDAEAAKAAGYRIVRALLSPCK